MPELKPLFTATVELAQVLSLGATPQGERRVIHITGGRFSGGRLSGSVLAGGADWQILQADGTAELDARYTLRTDSGALILVHSSGVRHGPPAVMARLARDEAVDAGEYYFRTAMRFETGDPELAWLNHAVAVAAGKRLPHAVELDVYELL